MKEIIIKVNGMKCEGCENRIKNALGAIEGIEEVQANYKIGTVKVNSKENVDIDVIKESINDIGFSVVEEN